jgi:hypothetical protein
MNPSTTSWNDTQKLLAFIIVIAFVLVIFAWMFFPPKADQGTIAVLNMLIGALVGLAGTVATFYFGSSRGERMKDATILSTQTAADTNGNGHANAAAPVQPPTNPVG